MNLFMAAAANIPCMWLVNTNYPVLMVLTSVLAAARAEFLPALPPPRSGL
jgi:hypothetical protein